MMLPTTRTDLSALDATLSVKHKLMSRLVKLERGVEPDRADLQRLSELNDQMGSLCATYGGIDFLLEAGEDIAGWQIVIFSAHSRLCLQEMIPPGVRVDRYIEKSCLFDEWESVVMEYVAAEPGRI